MVYMILRILGLFVVWILYMLVGAMLTCKLQPDNAVGSIMVILFWPIFLIILFVMKLLRKD